MATRLRKYPLVTQQAYLLSVMTQQEGNRFVQGIGVIRQKTKQPQGIGRVINGVLMHQLITNRI